LGLFLLRKGILILSAKLRILPEAGKSIGYKMLVRPAVCLSVLSGIAASA